MVSDRTVKVVSIAELPIEYKGNGLYEGDESRTAAKKIEWRKLEENDGK